MHHAHLTRSLTCGSHHFAPGHYLVEDHNAAEILHHSRGDGSVRLIAAGEVPPPPLWWQDPAVSEILVVRVGGFGDLLWLNAIYAEIKRRRPDLRIRHACFPRYADVLKGFVDEVVAYPTAVSEFGAGTYWLENIIEGSPCVGGEHPTDRIATRFGLAALDRKAAYRVTAKERKRAQRRFPRRSGIPRVCIQVESSTGNKAYPHIETLLYGLERTGIEILIVGDPSPNDGVGPANVFNARRLGLPIRESIALAAECDVIVGADSVFHHVGAALDIPVVGLFGPFHGESYLAGCRGTAIQGRRPCSPCHWHPRAYNFPLDQPCARTGRCEALAAVPPSDVASEVVRWLGLRKNNQTEGPAESGPSNPVKTHE